MIEDHSPEATGLRHMETIKGHPKFHKVATLVSMMSAAMSLFDDETEVQEIAVRIVAETLESKKIWEKRQ